MITLNDILYSVTSRLATEFKDDVFVDETVQGFDKSCFFVQILPSVSTAATRTTDKKVVLTSIKYLLGATDSRLLFNDVLAKLEQLFVRNIKVKDRYVNISSIEPNIYKDEVGDILDFVITMTFFDDIRLDLESFENMQDVELQIKEEV